MGWGKGKGKAVERALHQAEHQEERAAMRALARGDVAAALAHERNAEAIASAEHHPHWKGKGKGKGKGYGHPTEVVVVEASPAPVVVVEAAAAKPVVVEAVSAKPVVVEAVVVPGRKGCGKGVKGAERALHRAEMQEEAIAAASLASGDVVGAALHAERASELKAAEKMVHREVVRGQARHAHHEEKRQEHLAARDLAHGNLLGAIAHEVKACRAHHREQKLESELHRHRAW